MTGFSIGLIVKKGILLESSQVHDAMNIDFAKNHWDYFTSAYNQGCDMIEHGPSEALVSNVTKACFCHGRIRIAFIFKPTQGLSN